MKISVHLATSLILAAILYPFFDWKAVFVIAGGMLFDIDHYFWYVYKYRKFSLSECYRKFGVEGPKTNWKEFDGTVLVFHNIEFWLLMVVLSLYNQIALLLTIGLLLHNILDIIWHVFVPKRLIIDYLIIHWIYKRIIQKH